MLKLPIKATSSALLFGKDVNKNHFWSGAVSSGIVRARDSCVAHRFLEHKKNAQELVTEHGYGKCSVQDSSAYHFEDKEGTSFTQSVIQFSSKSLLRASLTFLDQFG